MEKKFLKKGGGLLSYDSGQARDSNNTNSFLEIENSFDQMVRRVGSRAADRVTQAMRRKDGRSTAGGLESFITDDG